MNIRYSAEEAGELVFDELSAAARLDINKLTQRTGLSSGQVHNGVRWLRDTLSSDAVITNVDHTYELALSSAAVADYRSRRISFLVRSLERLQRVIKAGTVKFPNESDAVLAVELIGTATTLLKRGSGVPAPREQMPERVR